MNSELIENNNLNNFYKDISCDSEQPHYNLNNFYLNNGLDYFIN
jgi:hypothetical protein